MKTKQLLLLIISFMVQGCVIAKSVNTPMTLPPDAFWIKNHWQTVSPAHWRSTKTILPGLNTIGLTNLFMSGSAQPTQTNLIWLKQFIGKNHPALIIDLRQETHVFVNSGLPISIYYKKNQINWSKTTPDVLAIEQLWLKELVMQKMLVVNQLGKATAGFKRPTHSMNLTIDEVITEEEIAKKAGFNYFRLTVPDYHPPSPYQVDQFLALLKTLTNNTWVHFHCAGGKGRTTLFMVMRDILANGKSLSLPEIINRQFLIGGINLLGRSSSLQHHPWKKKFHDARADFIQLFYRYANTAYPRESFSHWLEKQDRGLYRNTLKSAAYPKFNQPRSLW